MTPGRFPRLKRSLPQGVALGALFLAAASNVAPERTVARPEIRSPLAPVPARLFPSRKLVEQMGSNNLLDIPAPTALAINEARPFTPGALEVAPAFHFKGDDASRARATDCLAAAAWYEAGDDAVGERSVLQVVLNRARHPAYRSSICGVVFQGSDRETGCQFTFTCDGALHRIPSPAAWDRARKLATQALDGAVFEEVGAATHYHTDWVVPMWGPRLDKIAKVRTHIFFRFPAGYGRKGLLRPMADVVEPVIPQLAMISPAHKAMTEASETAALQPARAALVAMGGQAVAISPARAAGPQILGIAQGDMNRPGKWAMRSVDMCAGKPDCRIAAYPAGFMPMVGSRPLFVFVRDSRFGRDVSLWDCDRAPRPSPDQCLPEGRALERLLNRPQ